MPGRFSALALPVWRFARVFAFVGLALSFALPAWALEVPPLAGRRVNDHAKLLTAEQAARLEQKLAHHEQATGQQFALLTIPSLEGDPLEDFSIRVVESWKLGKKGKDDGLLLLVAAKDRKARIETGYGLEGSIPDVFAARVIRNTLAPAFRANQYGAGIERAFDVLITQAGGTPGEGSEAAPVAHEPPRGSRILKWIVLAVLFLLFPFAAILGSIGGMAGRGYRRRGGMFGGGFYGGGGGFGGGGFGGGGFGGGGGGFGGGGASGSW